MSGKRTSGDTQPIVPDRTEPGREPEMTVVGGDALGVAGDTALDLVPMGGRGTLIPERPDRAKSEERNASEVDREAVTVTTPPEEPRERSTDTMQFHPAPAVAPATNTLPMAQRPVAAVDVAPARPRRRLLLLIACVGGLLVACGALLLARKKHVEAPKAVTLPVGEAPAADTLPSPSPVVPTEPPSVVAPASSVPARLSPPGPTRRELPRSKPHRANDEPIF